MKTLKNMAVALMILVIVIALLPSIETTFLLMDGTWHLKFLNISSPIYTMLMITTSGVLAMLVTADRQIVRYLDRGKTFAATWLLTSLTIPVLTGVWISIERKSFGFLLYPAGRPGIIWSVVVAGFVLAVVAYYRNGDVTRRVPLPKSPQKVPVSSPARL